MPDSDNPDVTLYEKVLAGDREAAYLFCRTYINKVFGLCFSKLGDRSKAEEITQEAFLKFFKAIHRNAINDSAKTKGYLFQIARNLCTDYFRQTGSKRVILTDLDNEEKQSGEAYDNRSHDTPEDLVILEQRKSIFYEKFEQLREDHRDAIYLIHIEKFTYKEAAYILNCPVNTVKTRVNRAMLKLARLLKKNGRIK